MKNDFTSFVDGADDLPTATEEESKELFEAPDFIRGRKVLNRQPVVDAAYRIAIIGEAPGKEEEFQGAPFVGQSGKLLTGILTRCNIIREACFVGNLCQYKLPTVDLLSNWNRPEIQEGLKELRDDLERFKPNIVLLLGRATLYAAKGVDKLTLWRGSCFMGEGTFAGYKCIASFHPAFLLRQYNWTAYLHCDIVKAFSESKHHELILPDRRLIVDQPIDSLLAELYRLNTDERPIALDIEGYWHSLSCCSVSNSDLYSFIVPFSRTDGSHYWSEEEEWLVWKAFSTLLENPKVPKIFQNGLYDRFCLQYGYGIVVRGNVDDTMLKFWEWRCELRKKLSVQASILTKEVYWKHERVGKEDEEVAGH